MIIECKNFGPLREFSFSLDSDFTLIVGENNIGKSYAISLIYTIIKTLISSEAAERPFLGGAFLDNVAAFIPKKLHETTLKKYRTSPEKDHDITEIYRHLLIGITRSVFLDQFEKSIAGTFGEISNLENRRTTDPTTIKIANSSLTISMTISNGSVSIDDISVPSKIIYRRSKQHRNPKVSNGSVVLYGPEDDFDIALIKATYHAFHAFVEFSQEIASTISDVHYLPASRSGLYQALNAFGQIIAELSKRRSFLSQRIELPAISEPLLDYFLKLNEIKPSNRKSTDNPFATLADELEREALSGSVDFDHKSKKLFYRPYDLDLKLDLSSTSSMVSEVAPIVTYLKHILPEVESRRQMRRGMRLRLDAPRRKQIIFIEEPEAHLHPRTQTILMKTFAKMIRTDAVKIIMTSHSNFVFNKISNLVMARDFGGAHIQAFIFSRGENGTESRPLEVDQYGVSDENFSETAEDLFVEKMSLLDKIDTDAQDF